MLVMQLCLKTYILKTVMISSVLYSIVYVSEANPEKFSSRFWNKMYYASVCIAVCCTWNTIARLFVLIIGDIYRIIVLTCHVSSIYKSQMFIL